MGKQNPNDLSLHQDAQYLLNGSYGSFDLMDKPTSNRLVTNLSDNSPIRAALLSNVVQNTFIMQKQNGLNTNYEQKILDKGANNAQYNKKRKIDIAEKKRMGSENKMMNGAPKMLGKINTTPFSHLHQIRDISTHRLINDL